MKNKHVYKPNEVKVKKNDKGYWSTVKIDNFNGSKIPYGDVIGYKVSMYEAKRKFANDLNRANSRSGNNIQLHPDYYLKPKPKTTRKVKITYKPKKIAKRK